MSFQLHDLKLYCAKCGANLHFTIEQASTTLGTTIKVLPCPKCLTSEFYKGCAASEGQQS